MSFKNKKILITSGPTWVPIDEMRVLSNRSTGELGQILAQKMARSGARVTLLEGAVTRSLRLPSIKIIKFLFFEELLSQIKKELHKKYDIFIHAAAVSDYQLNKPFRGKLPSQKKNLNLCLIPTPKIIQMVKRIDPGIFLVGFKLEPELNSESMREKTKDLFQKARCNLVVANRLKKGKYQGLILDKNGNIFAKASSREKMAEELIKILENKQYCCFNKITL